MPTSSAVRTAPKAVACWGAPRLPLPTRLLTHSLHRKQRTTHRKRRTTVRYVLPVTHRNTKCQQAHQLHQFQQETPLQEIQLEPPRPAQHARAVSISIATGKHSRSLESSEHVSVHVSRERWATRVSSTAQPSAGPHSWVWRSCTRRAWTSPRAVTSSPTSSR